MIDPELYFYLLGLLVVFNMMSVLELTSLKVHLIKIFCFWNKKIKEIYTLDELEDYISLRWGYIGELLCCPLCYSTHLSWIISLIMFFVLGSPIYLCLFGALSWPAIAYSFYKKINQ